MAGRPVGRPLPGSTELPRAARRALRRHRSRAGAPPRGRFDPAGVLDTLDIDPLPAAHRRGAWLALGLGLGLALGLGLGLGLGCRDRVRVRVRIRVRVRGRIRGRVLASRRALVRERKAE